MQTFFEIMFFVSGFLIVWAMIGYPLSLRLLKKLYAHRTLKKNYDLEPTVTVMVVAHNEEKVIHAKLDNLLKLDYPQNKMRFIISSDHSTDQTNRIVQTFINNHPDCPMTLYDVKERKGKTNAQNEAYQLVETDYIVMSDANSMMKEDCIKELMASFISDDIVYVSGRLIISNDEYGEVSKMESSYWDLDVNSRDIEGRIQTITAGNGALYACRTEDYHLFDPIECHDSAMPVYYALQGKRAIANHDAIAYEKAGETMEDEFSRKVRMNRIILKHILPEVRILNVFRYKWFSYFYFGHRTCRYLLWLLHILVFISNAALVSVSPFYVVLFSFQILFYALALVKLLTKTSNKYVSFIYYYCLTVSAQYVGVFNELTGRAKPVWEKAESTR